MSQDRTLAPIPELPRLGRHLTVHQVDPDFLVYDTTQDRSVVLNPSAAGILELCDGSRTAATIALEVAKAFGVPVETVLPQVMASLQQFADMALLEEARPEPTLSPDERPRGLADLVRKEAEGYLVLLNPAVGAPIALDPQARAVFDLCDGTNTIGEMVEAAEEVFHASREEVLRTLHRTLRELRSAGVIG